MSLTFHNQIDSMKLPNTYDDHDEAEKAECAITGDKRLASERDGTEVIYNLFGQTTWTNFHKLDMFNLQSLKILLEKRSANLPYDKERYQKIINSLKFAAKSFDLRIPKHWL